MADYFDMNLAWMIGSSLLSQFFKIYLVTEQYDVLCRKFNSDFTQSALDGLGLKSQPFELKVLISQYDIRIITVLL